MDKNNKAPSSALLALTGAALALPGIAGKAHAAAPVSEPVLSYHATRYSEANIDSDKHLGGDRERYEIDTHQLGFATAIGKQTDMQLDLMVESMSGASPWYVQPDANNKPVQAMSGASIKEDRVDLQSRFNHFVNSDTVASLLLGYSDEDDYSAANIGFEFEKTLAQQPLTVSAGIGYSDDELKPTQGSTPVSVTRADKDALSAFVGVGVTVNARTVVQTSISLNDQQGYLSDPYKLAYVASLPQRLVSDSRPDDRRQWVSLTQLRHFVPAANAALHVNYRYFDDDWDIESHTLDLGWYQNVGNSWRIDTVVRYYSQTAAYFCAPYYLSPRADGLASSDYRLSPYGALSLRLRAVKSLGPWQLSAQWEGYEAKASHSLKSVDVESPGLVEFTTFSIGFDRVF